LSIPIVWKDKPNKKELNIIDKRFHEKSRYVNDMLTYEELSYHKKSDYKVDPKTSLHTKSSYKLDTFIE